jgi:hypothetical protein
MIFSHDGDFYISGFAWEEGKGLLKEEILLRDLQDDFHDRLNTLEQGDLFLIDYARKCKEAFIKFWEW